MISDEEEVKAKQVEEEKKKMSISLSGDIPTGEKGATTKLPFLSLLEYVYSVSYCLRVINEIEFTLRSSRKDSLVVKQTNFL